MGLPLWKPKDIETELDQEESMKHQRDVEDEESWSIFTHQLVHDNVYNHHINNTHHHNNHNNNTNRRNTSLRHTVNNNNNNNNNHSNNRHLSHVSSSIPIIANSSSLRRSRIARRHSMLASSLMDRRRSSRVHHLPGTSSSPPVRSELDRRLLQRINEKEDLLEQLQVTVSLLDQFLSARTALGSELMTLPSFITEDLPAVLESAASLAAMAPTVLSSSSSTHTDHNNNEVTTLHEMVDRLLQIPPYSTRIHNVEYNIITAHRRIREQLGLLGTTNIPSPIRPSSSSSIENDNNRASFLNFLETNSTTIPHS